ncbi:MAG: hypothetical protein LBS57_07300 [Treponema sp.]|jgi:hypothetical protein|nr:hypothetical protein [Treponema sp.]
MKRFFGMAAALFLLLASCAEDLGSGTIIFYNFSPVTVTELKAYDSARPVNTTIKNDLVYTHTGIMGNAAYHTFWLPEGVEYFFEVRTAGGETYEGGPFSNYGITGVMFSVDYDLLEYDL